MKSVNLLILFSVCLIVNSSSSIIESKYVEVDKFKVGKYTAKVYFNDPFKNLIAQHADFNT
jgi:hypothetical protein